MKKSLPVVSPPHHALPPLYAGWMADCLGGPIPAETNATCHECAMLPDPATPPGTVGTFFAPDTKCCTYLPELANFLVGRILRDEDAAGAAGRESVRKRIESRTALSPLGLYQNATFKLVFRNTVSGFGHSRALRCPHYIAEGSGLCGVWQHRESVCSTWFCKHVRGPIGKEFWNRLQQLLTSVEAALARHCALALEISPAAFQALFPFTSPRDLNEAVDFNEIDGAVDLDRQQLIWGPWSGREAEFFQRCAAVVDAMSWSDVLAACGSEAAVFARLLQDCYAKLVSASLPERLAVGSFQTLRVDEKVWRVQTYSFLDPLDVPRPMMEALHLFDGRSTADAIRAMSDKVGVAIEPLAIQRLLDHRVLVAAG
jgi:hypothetical protein